MTENLPDTELNTRHASIEDLVGILRERQARAHDVVASAQNIRAKDGNLVIKNAEVEMSLEGGVGTANGTYRPTEHCDSQIAERLDIPAKYLARLRGEAIDLYDSNVNAWLHGKSVRRAGGDIETVRPGLDGKFLARCFSDGNGGGVARALLSDRYRSIDDYDILFAALDGIRRSGETVEIRDCQLSTRRMYVDVFAPGITANADILLGGYRNPFGGGRIERQHGRDDAEWRRQADQYGLGSAPDGAPIVFAGFRITNSEVGCGAATITPRLLVQVCTNGMTINQDAIRNVHLGEKLDEGIVKVSNETRRKQLELVTARTVDAVETFLDRDYLAATIGRIEEQAGKPVAEPETVIKKVSTALRFTKDEQAGILAHFIAGGQLTAGGVLNAVTSFSQTVADPDRAATLDGQALRALSLV